MNTVKHSGRGTRHGEHGAPGEGSEAARLRSENAALRARIVLLETAIRPFAKILDIIETVGTTTTGDTVCGWVSTKGEALLLRSDLNRARAAFLGPRPK